MSLAGKDVDDQIAADWSAIREKMVADEPEEAAEPVSAETEAPVAEKPETPGKAAPAVARDEEGRFKPAPKEAKVKEAKPVKAEQEAAPAEKAVEARDVNRAPSTWKPTARAEWEKLPPSVRAEIHRRESDFLSGQSQLLPDAKLGSNIRQVAEPYRMLIEAEGGTPEAAFADLLKTAAVFRVGTQQEKYQTLANIANRFGLDLRVFSQQRGAQPGQAAPRAQEFRDPRVDQILAEQQRQSQERARSEQTNAETSVTRWMNESDSQGNPLRPYVNDVTSEMSVLLPQIRAQDPTLTHAQALQAAYERAIWAHPEIRALLQQKQQSELEAQRRTDNQSRVRDARRATSVNVPRRASLPATGKPGSLEETIAATARELGLIT